MHNTRRSNRTEGTSKRLAYNDERYYAGDIMGCYVTVRFRNGDTFSGIVKDYGVAGGTHLIKSDSGKQRWIDLNTYDIDVIVNDF